MECALLNGLVSVHFETDCLGILRVIDEPEDWPVFFYGVRYFTGFRARFVLFSISHISRNNNVRADRLAKNARV
ncbi:unnamed protein product [Arabidopsis halleri]